MDIPLYKGTVFTPTSERISRLGLPRQVGSHLASTARKTAVVAAARKAAKARDARIIHRDAPPVANGELPTTERSPALKGIRVHLARITHG